MLGLAQLIVLSDALWLVFKHFVMPYIEEKNLLHAPHHHDYSSCPI